MPKWWPFKQKENSLEAENAVFAQAEKELRAHIKQQQSEGVSAQAIVYFVEKQSQALEKQEQTIAVKGKLRAFDLVYSEMQPRIMENLSTGKALEMSGQIEAACHYYEKAILDQVATRFPYEHLRVIYRREGKHEEARRVCQLATENPFLKESDIIHFQKWITKLVQL